MINILYQIQSSETPSKTNIQKYLDPDNIIFCIFSTTENNYTIEDLMKSVFKNSDITFDINTLMKHDTKSPFTLDELKNIFRQTINKDNKFDQLLKTIGQNIHKILCIINNKIFFRTITLVSLDHYFNNNKGINKDDFIQFISILVQLQATLNWCSNINSKSQIYERTIQYELQNNHDYSYQSIYNLLKTDDRFKNISIEENQELKRLFIKYTTIIKNIISTQNSNDTIEDLMEALFKGTKITCNTEVLMGHNIQQPFTLDELKKIFNLTNKKKDEELIKLLTKDICDKIEEILDYIQEQLEKDNLTNENIPFGSIKAKIFNFIGIIWQLEATLYWCYDIKKTIGYELKQLKSTHYVEVYNLFNTYCKFDKISNKEDKELKELLTQSDLVEKKNHTDSGIEQKEENLKSEKESEHDESKVDEEYAKSNELLKKSNFAAEEKKKNKKLTKKKLLNQLPTEYDKKKREVLKKKREEDDTKEEKKEEEDKKNKNDPESNQQDNSSIVLLQKTNEEIKVFDSNEKNSNCQEYNPKASQKIEEKNEISNNTSSIIEDEKEQSDHEKNNGEIKEEETKKMEFKKKVIILCTILFTFGMFVLVCAIYKDKLITIYKDWINRKKYTT